MTQRLQRIERLVVRTECMIRGSDDWKDGERLLQRGTEEPEPVRADD